MHEVHVRDSGTAQKYLLQRKSNPDYFIQELWSMHKRVLDF